MLPNFDLKKLLNEYQYKAVIHPYSPALVVAGAGSGKTRVITYRIAYLLTQGVEPYNILGLTFTNKAANEMKDRIASLFANRNITRKLTLGTFHSVFNKILKQEAHILEYTQDYSIYTPEDAYVIIREIVNSLHLDNKKYDYRGIYKRISYLKNYLYTVEKYKSDSALLQRDAINKMREFVTVYDLYEKKKKKNNAMDFDDLLLNTYFLLKNHTKIRDKYRALFKHILIDEFQDTNAVQYEIVKMLANKDDDIMVVGDDAQSIYSFRGAIVQNVYRFVKEYNAKTYQLKQNYRSTQHIVNASNHLISFNSEQIKKEVFSKKHFGSKILIRENDTDSDEAFFIARDIEQKKLQFNYNYKDFAILYRTNAQSRKIEEAFLRNGIPYKVYGGFSFYQRKEVKDVLAYLSFLINRNDTVAFSRIINFPKRGIGTTTINKILNHIEINNMTLSGALQNIDNIPIQTRAKGIIKNFITDIENFASKMEFIDVASLASEMVNHFGIINAFKEEQLDDKARNVEELLNSMSDFVDNASELQEGNVNGVSVKDYLEGVSLLTGNDEPENEDDNKVKLMTVHTAKGLEFNVVYIIGAEEKLFPINQSLDNQERISEERRLFYVAMTRAKENLIISYANMRFKYNSLDMCDPSRFLKELPKDNIIFQGTNPSFSSTSSSVSSNFTVTDNKRKNISYVSSTSTHNSFGKSFTDNKNLKKISSRPKSQTQKISSYQNLSTGKKVRHPRFGIGIIKELFDAPPNTKAVIDFETAGTRTILLKFSKLVIVD